MKDERMMFGLRVNAIFLFALLLSIVLGGLSGYGTALLLLIKERGLPMAAIGMYYGIAYWIGRAIDPVLVLIIFYLIGRKIDLKATLTSSVLLLFAGAYVGNLLGCVFVIPVVIPELWFSGIVMGLSPFSSFHFFFVAFSALAIAYLRQEVR